MIEARIAIETESAALAAARRTPADLRGIRRALTARGMEGLPLTEHIDADNDALTHLFDTFLPRLRQHAYT